MAPLRLPFTHCDALLLQPSVCGEGAGSLAHWSRLAEGLAARALRGDTADAYCRAMDNTKSAVQKNTRLFLARPAIANDDPRNI